ncbi:MAG TPA: calcium-binding protein [Allosphingosinicella sp.]|jgi:Ca2+-binding RTX toxin-like protein
MTTGTEGNDILANDPAVANETIDALGGNDFIIANTPDFTVPQRQITVSGGDGYDTLVVNASNYIAGSASGFNGQISVRQGMGIGWSVSWTSIERLEITDGKFFTNGDITLGEEVDIVRMTAGLGGRINTGGGNDEIYFTGTSTNARIRAEGGAGDDLVDLSGLTSAGAFGSPHEGIGGEANDVLRGSAYNDRLEGGAGNDFLYFNQPVGFVKNSSQNFDTGLGDAGNDVILFGAELTSFDVVNGGADIDQLVIQGDYSGARALTLGANVTAIENLAILAGNDTRFGDAGTGFYDYSITLLDSVIGPGVQLVVDANRLRVGEDFTFNGSAETDGSFFIYGGGGVDLLTGGAKNDVFIFGGQGQFGAGDVLVGGGGIDQLGLRGNYTIIFGAGQLVGVEQIGMVSAQDTRYGPLGSVYSYDLTMADENVDSIQMTVDAAPLRAGETLKFDGSAEDDGSFRVFGGRDNDIIVASQNGDILAGNGGADSLTGGGGADVFRYVSVSDSTGSATDHILDFAAGTDKVDLARIDADAMTAGEQAFSWIGSNAFSGMAGELRAYQSGSDWFVEGDTDGDAAADLVIQLTVNGGPIAQGDFLP